MTIDAATKSLLHFEGSPTTFTDETGKVWTRRGASPPVINGTRFKFGATAGYFLGAGTIDTPDHADFTFGTNDFTIDFWMRLDSLSDGWLFAQAYDAMDLNTPSISAYVNWLGAISAVIGYNSASGHFSINQEDGYLVATSWYHIAIVRSGYLENIVLYINGVALGSVFCDSTFIVNDSPYRFVIGGSGEAGTGALYNDAWIDEFRISNVARWIADFTPPTRPYGSPPSKQKIIMTGGE